MKSTDQTTTGTLGALNATVTLASTSVSTVAFVITGTWAGTITFQASIDGVTYQAINVTTLTNVPTGISISGLGGGSSAVTTTTANGTWVSYVTAPWRFIRATMTAYTSGTATVTINTTTGPPMYTTVAPVMFDNSLNNRSPLVSYTNVVGSSQALTVGLMGWTTGSAGVKIRTNNLGSLAIGAFPDGGATTFTLISAATTNATSVKASAGTVYGIQASNTGAAVAFLKIFNLAAAPTVGTSVAAMTLIIPAGGGITVPVAPSGFAFGTGISIAITGVATTADTTAVALAQVVINLQYA